MLTLYKIYKEGDNNFYIGSTNDFHRRMKDHKSNCNTRNTKLYNYICENGGWSSWNMKMIGECGSVSGEIKYIKEKKPSLNTFHREEYDRKAYNKKYRESNKEFLKINKPIYAKKYRMKIKDYKYSWGGHARWNNNLLSINPNLFN